ncbi:unnamed protein product [Miscanthus lutarioriparius]|uniref:Uncharacterized protein n=1 Tax=Miscanthus lutarioriparius TaxID=422564 RepID=A0A811MNE4_9POAL|nr:unnamed protein product [Miscanthus lutarioriparius]
MPRPALPETTRARRFVAASSCPVVAHAIQWTALPVDPERRGSDGERAWGVGKPGDGSAHYRSRSSSSPPVSMGSPNSTSSSSPDLAAILEYLTAVLEYVTTILTLRDVGNSPSSTRFARRTGGGRHPNDQTNSLYANGDMEDLDSQWNLMLIIVSTFLLSIMRI